MNLTDEDIAAELHFFAMDCALGDAGLDAEARPSDGNSLAGVLDELRRLREEVAGARAAPAAKAPPKLLSYRAAAKMLGVCPRDTLPDLVRCGALATVQLKGRTKIPLGEVERVAREGAEAVVARKKRRSVNHEAPLVSDLWA